MIVLPASATISSFGGSLPLLALLGPGELVGLVQDSTFFGKFILLVLLA